MRTASPISSPQVALQSEPPPHARTAFVRAKFALPPCVIALALIAAGCGARIDKTFCDRSGCDLSDDEWQRLQSLTGLGDAPPDPSNAFVDNPAAAALGQKLFFDARFSGPATQV